MSTDTPVKAEVEIGDYQYGFHDPTDNYEFKSRKGLDAEIVTQISEMKKEPEFMKEFVESKYKKKITDEYVEKVLNHYVVDYPNKIIVDD